LLASQKLQSPFAKERNVNIMAEV